MDDAAKQIKPVNTGTIRYTYIILESPENQGFTAVSTGCYTVIRPSQDIVPSAF